MGETGSMARTKWQRHLLLLLLLLLLVPLALPSPDPKPKLEPRPGLEPKPNPEVVLNHRPTPPTPPPLGARGPAAPPPPPRHPSHPRRRPRRSGASFIADRRPASDPASAPAVARWDRSRSPMRAKSRPGSMWEARETTQDSDSVRRALLALQELSYRARHPSSRRGARPDS
ncbi:hypothetical protein ColTof3_05787 [Colletotrichum tofieldiae]|nr:hypothetical protein ColTof3_05787 [Colletotrichum tofieldiae]